jgi:hypothetical protein
MLSPESQITQSLTSTATVITTEAYGLGRDAVGAWNIDEYPWAQRIEVLDQVTCPLCRQINGMVFDKRSPAYQQYRWPLHIGCRGIIVDIGRGEMGDDGKPLKPDFVQPDQALIDKHGHFLVNPDKYEALRMPARPEGRDFIHKRMPGGRWETVWRLGLSDAALRSTLKDMAGSLARDTNLTGAVLGAEYLKLVGHAAGNALFRDTTQQVLLHMHDWDLLLPPGGVTELSDIDFASIPYWATEPDADPAPLVCSFRRAGRELIGIYSPTVRIGQLGVEIPDVAIIYDPGSSLITDIFRAEGGAEEFMSYSAFRPLSGRWPSPGRSGQ